MHHKQIDFVHIQLTQNTKNCSSSKTKLALSCHKQRIVSQQGTQELLQFVWFLSLGSKLAINKQRLRHTISLSLLFTNPVGLHLTTVF